jgi:hypothetical protein
LSRSDAPDAGVLVSPTISRRGPSTPPNAIAPASHGMSCRISGVSRVASAEYRPRSHTMERPRPDPR